ncbi:MAG: hypothetical protein HZB53_13805 [Chloroflexi bacterium]|nr:hypothetical protein [Chloroflexota bacterium]
MNAHRHGRASRLVFVVASSIGLWCLSLAWLTSVALGASLVISKGASASTVVAGQLVTYTLQLAYNGSGALIVDVTDTVPSGSDFWTCVNCTGYPLNGAVVWHVIGLTTDAPVELQFTVRAKVAGLLRNSAYSAVSAGYVAIGPPVDVTVSPGAPSSVAIVAPSSLVVGSATVISATVRDVYNNAVADGTLVAFSADHGLFGGAPVLTTTTSGGVAVAAYSAVTVPLTSLIAVTAGSAGSTASLATVPSVPTSVAITALPASVLANGSATAALTVTVRDVYGNGVADNTPVAVTTTIGTLGTGFSTIAGVTNRGNYVTFVKSIRAGLAVLTAASAGITSTTSVGFYAGPAVRLGVSANPAQITADSASSSEIVARAYDVLDNITENQGLTITVAANGGVFVATGTTMQTLAAPAGAVTATLRADTQARTVTVTASANGLPAAVGQVVFASGPADYGTLAAVPPKIIADGATTAAVTLNLYDFFGNVVSGTVPVTLTTTAGSISPMLGSSANGRLVAVLTSGTQLTTAVVSVAVAGIAAPITIAVPYVIGPPAAGAYVIAPGATLTVSTLARPVSATLTISLTNRLGQPLTAGEIVSISDTLGNFFVNGTTSASGVITVSFVPLHAGTDLIMVAGMITATGPALAFLPGPLIGLVISPTVATAAASVPVPFSLSGRDENSNTVGGLSPIWSTVPISTNRGSIDAAGVFTGGKVGALSVQGQVGLFTQTAAVTVVPGPVFRAVVQAAPTVIASDGVQAATLVFNLYDAYDNVPSDGQPMTATATLGVVGGTGNSVGGRVFRFFTSLASGVAQLGVLGLDSLHVTGATTITVQPGAPARAVVTATTQFISPTKSIPANGTATAALTVQVRDVNRNAVVAGQSVRFTTSLGTLDNSMYTTDGNGLFTATLSAATISGTASFTATWSNNPLTLTGDSVAFVVGNLTHVVMQPRDTLTATAGAPVTFTARGLDAYDAQVPNLAFDWTRYNLDGSGAIDARGVFTPVRSGSVFVQAHASDGQGEAYDSAVVLILPAPAASASLSATPAQIPADGASTAFLDIAASDAYGNPASYHTFTLIPTLGSLPTPATADGAGHAGVTYTAGTATGSATLFLRDGVGAVLTVAGSIELVPGPAVSGTLSAAFDLPADGASQSVITLTLRDAFGNAVGAGQTLPVSTTSALIAIGSHGVTYPDGSFTFTVRSISTTLAPPYEWADVWINGSLSSAQAVRLVPGPVAQFVAIALTTTLAAGGDSTLVRFDLNDAFGHPVLDGAPFTPTLSSPLAAFLTSGTTVGGAVTRTLASGDLVGTLWISMSGVLTASGDLTYTIVPAAPSRIVIASTPPTPTVGTVAVVTGTIRDAYGNHITSPVPVTVTALFGAFLPTGGSQIYLTAQGGYLTVSLTSTVAYTELLSFNGPQGEIFVLPASQPPVYQPAGLAAVSLSPSGWATVTAGITSTVTARGYDRFGNIIPGMAFSWTQSASPGQPGYVTLPLTGSAAALLPRIIGGNRITATEGVTASAPLSLTIIPGAPAAAGILISPPLIRADGTGTADVYLSDIVDTQGNRAADGEPLTVTLTTPTPVYAYGVSLTANADIIVTSTTEAGAYPVRVAGVAGNLALTGTASLILAPGMVGQATVTASPASMRADGLSAATLIVTMRDRFGNLIADGLPVFITSTLGTLSAFTPSANGTVTCTFTAGFTAGLVTIYADGVAATPPNVITLRPGPAAQASVAAASPSLVADGASRTTLTVTVMDVYGNALEDGNAVAVTTTLGSITGSMLTKGGSITRTLTAPLVLGTARFYVDGFLAHGDSVAFVPGPAVRGTVAPAPRTVTADGVAGSTVRIALFDAWGHAVADGNAPVVTTTLGTLSPPAGAATTGGVLTYTLSSTAIGRATLYANAFVLTPTAVVTFTPGPAHHITVTPSGPLTLTAGLSTTFRADLWDRFDNPITGVNFIWRTALGPGQGLIDNSGVFTGTRAGYMAVIAAGAGVTSTYNEIYVLPGAIARASVSAETTWLQSYIGNETVISVTLRDAYDNLVDDGANAGVSVNRGYVYGTGPSAGGVITRMLGADTTIGGVLVWANGITATPAPVLWLVPGPAVSATVEARPPVIVADGVSTSTLFITLRDSLGRRVRDGTQPAVTATLGALSGGPPTIDGVVTRTLTAGFDVGIAHVNVPGVATSGDLVQFLPAGAPALAQWIVLPARIPADNISTAAFTVTITDASGHRVSDGTLVYLTTTLGIFESGGASGWFTATSGQVTGTLHAELQPGNARIGASGVQPATQVELRPVVDNDGFDSGSTSPWVVGSTTAALSSTLSVGDRFAIPRSGTRFLLLGTPSISNTGHATGTAWAYQTVRVPVGAPVLLTLWYRMFTFDVLHGCRIALWDSTDVSVRTADGMELALVARDGYTDAACGSYVPALHDLGWRKAAYDMTPYAGQTIQIYVGLSNRNQPVDDSWVYVDDVSITPGVMPPVYRTYIPMIVR